MKIFAFILVFAFSSVELFADERPEPIVVTSSGAVLASSAGVTWAPGRRGEFNYSDLTNLNWQPFSIPHDFQSGREPIWYRFSVYNPSNRLQDLRLTSMEAQISDFVALHITRKSGVTESFYSGSKFPMDSRPIKTHSLQFPIELGPDETIEVSLGVSSIYSRNLLYQIQFKDQLDRTDGNLNRLFGFHFGLCLFAVLLNLGIWMSLKDGAYLCFAVAASLALITQLVGIGYAFMMIPGNVISVFSELQLILICLLIAAKIWFNRDFLQIKTISKKLWYFENFLIFLSLPLIAVLSHPSPNNVALLSLYGGIAGVTGVIYAILAIRNRSTPYGWYYLIGFTIAFGGGTYWNLAFNGQIAPTTLNLNLYMASQMVENALMAYVFFKNVVTIKNQAQLADANKQEAERMDMFLRLLNHDLSNYVTIIKGAGERMGREPINQKNMTKLSSRIINAVNRQFDVLSSVQKLMDLGKNNKTLELTPVDLHSLMDDLSEVFQQKLEEKNIKLLISASRYDPIYVLAERKMLLSNVLGNLLQNAIKFSSIGGRIMIFLSNSPSEIKVTIKDQGIGIPQTIMAKLFNPDKRSSRPGTNGETGSGFGLPICKSCMELFGGALTIESKTAEESPDQHGTAITLIFKHAPRTGQLLQPKPASSLPQMQNAQHPEQ